MFYRQVLTNSSSSVEELCQKFTPHFKEEISNKPSQLHKHRSTSLAPALHIDLLTFFRPDAHIGRARAFSNGAISDNGSVRERSRLGRRKKLKRDRGVDKRFVKVCPFVTHPFTVDPLPPSMDFDFCHAISSFAPRGQES